MDYKPHETAVQASLRRLLLQAKMLRKLGHVALEIDFENRDGNYFRNLAAAEKRPHIAEFYRHFATRCDQSKS